MIFKVTWKELELLFAQISDYLSAEFIVLQILRLSKVSILKLKTLWVSRVIQSLVTVFVSLSLILPKPKEKCPVQRF